jgi:signal transduction histidine kinase
VTGAAGPSRISSALWGAVLAAALALPTAALVLAVIDTRLDEGGRRLDAGLARVASSWLAERVALLPAESRAGFLDEAGRRMGARAGLHDRERGFAPGSALAGVAAADIERVLSQDIDELELAGLRHQAAAASLRSPLSHLSVVLAVPPCAAALPRAATQARLGVLALLFLLAAAVFGACFGLDFGLGLEALARRIGAADAAQVPATGQPPAVTPEISEIESAVLRLEQRLALRDAPERGAPAVEPGAVGGRGDLLTSVARGLHRPLETIVERAQRLLDGLDGELGPSQREDILVVRRAGDRLLDLVRELLDLTSLLEVGIRLELEPVAIAEVAEEVLRSARGELKQKPIDLTLEVAAGREVVVHGDRQRLWQVLTNLVSNGIKFTERGVVTVRVGRDPESTGMARLEVEDTGVGIPSLDQATVFQTFRQLGARARGQRGTGLGLAICRRLVELHGGTIRVSSRPGHGALFTVLLPEGP